jgi:antitoxin YefM
MRAVTLTDAKRNLESVFMQVLDDAEPTVVVGENGRQVVMMPLDDFNTWQETRYLLSSPANAAHLRRSIEEAEAGRKKERELLSS